MARWHFNIYRPQDKRRDPIQGEFFSSESISDPGRALVREGIQNSLDASSGDEPVLVRIFVSGVDNAKSNNQVREFFTGGWEHFHAHENGSREIPDEKEPCEFLVFEDFNTKGLTGDISEVRHVTDHRCQQAPARYARAWGAPAVRRRGRTDVQPPVGRGSGSLG